MSGQRLTASGRTVMNSSIPDMRESRLIKDANAVYEGVDVFHSTVYDFEQSVIRRF